jgi:hypothetical protein
MDRSEIERQELTGAIRRVLPRDGRAEMQFGLTLFRVSTPSEPIYGFPNQVFVSSHGELNTSCSAKTAFAMTPTII